MKKFFLVILTLISIHSYSQEIFNVILEDTATHVASNVIETSYGYIVLSGTSNENLIRSFALTKINFSGNILEKNIFGTDSVEYWEGFKHSLKKTNDNSSFFPGTIKSDDNKSGIFIFSTDNDILSNQLLTYDYDTIWKSAFNITRSSDAFYITGQHYNPEADYAQLFILKSDLNGNKLWKKFYGNIYESGDQIILTSDNNIIVGGVTNQSFTSGSNWYLIKTDTAGNLVWEKNFGHGSRNDGAVSALVETPDSSILACGSYPGIKTSIDTYYDGCIRKIDKNGDLVWEQLYRNYSYYRSSELIIAEFSISNIHILENNDLIVSGSSLSYYPKNRGILMKLNSEGKIKWHKYYYADTTTSNWQYINSSKQTSDNGFILSGYGNDYSNIGYDPPQQRWLIKTDSLGMDGLSNTAPDALEVDIDVPSQMCAFDTTEQYLYIAGPTAPYTVSISNGQQFDSIYYPPVFVPQEIGPGTIEISYNGISTLEFEEPEVTISNHDWGECIAIPIAFHVGNQVGFVNFDITVTDGWGNNKTTTKSIYVTTCPDGINDALLDQLQIYPNPANKSITIDLNNNHRNLNADIFDTQGKHVLSTYITGEQTTIDISTLPPGTYQIVIENTSHNFTVVR